MTIMLRLAGYNVVCTTSPGEAEQMVRDGLIPELLLTGYVFPSGDGVEVARRIREVAPRLPVVIATTGALECPYDLPALRISVLQKPFVSGALRTAVAKAMEPVARA